MSLTRFLRVNRIDVLCGLHGGIKMGYCTNIGSNNNANDVDITKFLSEGDEEDDAEKVTKMRFDTLGPAVITETGKVRFFEDWEGKTEQEKEDILKIIIPRNQQRLQHLKEQENVEPNQMDNQ